MFCSATCNGAKNVFVVVVVVAGHKNQMMIIREKLWPPFWCPAFKRINSTSLRDISARSTFDRDNGQNSTP